MAGTMIEGKLITASEEEIVVEEERGKMKKKEILTHRVPLGNIKSTKIQIKF